MAEEKSPLSNEDLDLVAARLKEKYGGNLDDEPVWLQGKMLSRRQIILELEGHTEWARLFVESIVDAVDIANILGLDIKENYDEVFKIVDRARGYD